MRSFRTKSVAIIGVEAGGRGNGLGDNAATLSYGSPGVLQGSFSMLLQDQDGQIQETHSVSAGLDYPGVGPEHALLLAAGRVRYQTASDEEALEAVRACSESEGILPALESAHALVGARAWAAKHPGRADPGVPLRPRRQRHADTAEHVAGRCAMKLRDSISEAVRAAQPRR